VIGNILVDTGPLIALVDRRDRHHHWTRSQLAEIVPPLQTCEAVLTEACHLARRVPGGVPAVLALFEQHVCALTFELAANFENVAAGIQRYSDVPISLADACLVRMSEIVSPSTILTLDSDFRVYRRHKRQAIPLLMPPTT
jgi:predicted nucleic acid-binding protein